MTAPFTTLDMAAKLDQTAAPSTTTGSKINADRGPSMAWPAPFGRDLTKEEGMYSVDDRRLVLILHSIRSKIRRFNQRFS